MDFFDLHCDTAHRLAEGESLANGNAQVTLDKAREIGRWVQLFAMFVQDNKPGTDSAYEEYCGLIAAASAQIREHGDRIAQCRTMQEIDAALESGRRAAVFSVENGAVLGGRIERLEQLQRDGVRFLTLTWFGENELGGGSSVGGRLTPFGRSVVQELPRYGIVPDISHLSDEGVADVFELYDGPLAATHSNVRSVTGHHRNLTRRQIEEIVRRRGIIGINLYRSFLNGEPSRASRDDVYRHLDAFLSLGAQDTVCFGTDFDGADVPDDIRDISGIPGVYEYLLGRGLSETLLQKVFFENACAFCRRVL